MKYHRLKDMVLGAIVATLIVGVAPTAFAKVSKMNIPVSFNNIKVVIDGKELKTDKEPFTYEGITYLPVRAVAEAVGKDVKWDSTTQTVTLSGVKDAAENKDIQTTANGFSFSEKYTTRVSSTYTYTTSDITNNTNKEYSMIQISATYYGADGTVMGKGTAYVYDIKSGQTKSFETMVNGDFSAAEKVIFQTDYTQ